MTDQGEQSNPITEEWIKHPEWRADFMKEMIVGSYKSLFERLETQAIDINIDGGA